MSVPNFSSLAGLEVAEKIVVVVGGGPTMSNFKPRIGLGDF